MTNVQAIFTTALDLIGKDKVKGLLEDLGYDGEPTPAYCMEVLDQEGESFSIPFGKLMKEAAASPVAKAKFLVAARTLKASGTTDTSNMTAEEKSEMGLSWFNSIASLFTTGLSSVDDIIDATNGTNGQVAQAQILLQERLLEEQQQKKTLYWIVGGIGVLMVVVIFVIALTKRN